MLRSKPKLTYKGLTVVLSKPSRFDNLNLLSAKGGKLFDDNIRPEFNRAQCDIRVAEDDTPLVEGTKVLLLCGIESVKKFLGESDRTIGELRGSVFQYKDTNIHCVPTFSPQDAADIIDYEGQFNSKDGQEETDEQIEDSFIDEKRRHGRTKRKNFAFWFKKDLEKCKTILKSGIPKRPFEPNYILSPPVKDVVAHLKSCQGKSIFIDLETWYPSCDLQCIGIATNENIYVVPIYLPNREIYSPDVFELFRALATSSRTNTIVAHNGSGFDYPVLVNKYHIPLSNNLYDTMVANHRIYSEIEKSLGHCTSLWTFEPFHKDEGDEGYSNMDQARRKWAYCGKDVYTMMLIYEAQRKFAAKIPGMLDSIDSIMKAIRPYLTIELQGFRYNKELLDKTIAENDRRMTHYISWLKYLIGESNLKEIAGKSKKNMPGSNIQCCRYFHDMLGYPVVSYGKETKKGTKNPSLGKKAMYKLRLKHDNPVIDICLAYRRLARESGSLGFESWENKI